ncbi:MAG: glycosyltransferase [Bacillota bacterium]
MDKIKIMYILRNAEGGMKNHVQSLIERINADRFQPVLVCPGTIAAKIQVNCKVYKMEISDVLSPRQDWYLLKHLRKIMENENPHIIHAHGAKASFLAKWAARKANVPALLTTAHNFIYQSPTPWLKGRIFSYLQKHFAPPNDHYISVSKALAKSICKNENISLDKMSVIYNGIDLKQFELLLDCHAAKEALHLDIKEPVVGVIARLIPQKGVHHFLKMADIISKKLPGCQFLIIGNGPQRDILIKQAHNMGIEARIIFLGHREDIPVLLPIVNVLVIPSLSEGMSITALEGMAARRPIVAYNTGGLSEIIIHEENGLLIKRGDITRLAQAVLELLVFRKKAERLGNAARKTVEASFTVEKMIQETEKVYEKILTAKGLKLSKDNPSKIAISP